MVGRVCIPIHDPEGRLVAYAGRWVGTKDTLPEGEGRYKLPAGFHKNLELFNLYRVKHVRHLVIVEGYFGAIRLHGEHVPAVALMGSSVSNEQVALLTEHCPNFRAITVMLDGSEAARTAADTVAARLTRHWWVRVADLPEGGQPDTVPETVLEKLLRRAPRGGVAAAHTLTPGRRRRRSVRHAIYQCPPSTRVWTGSSSAWIRRIIACTSPTASTA
jgi:DNA primase